MGILPCSWDESQLSAEPPAYFLVQIKSTMIYPVKKDARSALLSHNKRHLPSGNSFSAFVARPSFFFFLVPGHHGNKR